MKYMVVSSRLQSISLEIVIPDICLVSLPEGKTEGAVQMVLSFMSRVYIIPVHLQFTGNWGRDYSLADY